ncbi:MAG: alpha/beta hydrolase [Spirochaetia bacterium]
MTEKDAVIITPRGRAEAAVILMHGLGADGHDFESLVPELRMPASPSLRWIFPHAPVRPVTINGGVSMRAWYDIMAIDQNAPEDEAGIRESARLIGTFIQRELDQGIPAGKIILAGFSQGGAMALFTALRWPERLGGLIAMSCYLPLPATLSEEASPANSALPVFMAHGTFDPVVPFGLGEAARDALLQRGHEVAWHTYQMQHGVSQQEITDVREWILRILLI